MKYFFVKEKNFRAKTTNQKIYKVENKVKYFFTRENKFL